MISFKTHDRRDLPTTTGFNRYNPSALAQDDTEILSLQSLSCALVLSFHVHSSACGQGVVAKIRLSHLHCKWEIKSGTSFIMSSFKVVPIGNPFSVDALKELPNVLQFTVPCCLQKHHNQPSPALNFIFMCFISISTAE